VAYTKETCEFVLSSAGIGWDEIDLFITHQGNARMVELVLEALEIDPARAVNDIVHHGNTSGASVPIALSEALESGRIGDDSLVLLTSVGAGYTFGAALYRF